MTLASRSSRSWRWDVCVRESVRPLTFPAATARPSHPGSEHRVAARVLQGEAEEREPFRACRRGQTHLVAASAAIDPIPEHDTLIAVLVTADGAAQTPQINPQVVLPVRYASPRATARPPRVTDA